MGGGLYNEWLMMYFAFLNIISIISASRVQSNGDLPFPTTFINFTR